MAPTPIIKLEIPATGFSSEQLRSVLEQFSVGVAALVKAQQAEAEAANLAVLDGLEKRIRALEKRPR